MDFEQHDQMIADAVINKWGKDALLTPAGGTEKTIQVIIDQQIELFGEGGAFVRENINTATYRASDAEFAKSGDTLLINGITWALREVVLKDGALVSREIRRAQTVL